MEALITSLLNNEYFKILSALVTLASAIAAAIPTPNPDSFLGKIYRVIDFVAINIGYAKDTGKDKPL
jgi:hypothetical protein